MLLDSILKVQCYRTGCSRDNVRDLYLGGAGFDLCQDISYPDWGSLS